MLLILASCLSLIFSQQFSFNLEMVGIYEVIPSTVFVLQMEKSSYVIGIHDKQLRAVHWGNKVDLSDFTQVSEWMGRGPHDASYLGEYPVGGKGDFGISSLEIEFKDGSNTLDLEYESHEIVKGKSHSKMDVPHVRANEKDTTLILHTIDRLKGVQVSHYYTLHHEYNIISKSSKIVSESEIEIRNVASFARDFRTTNSPDVDFHLSHFTGSWGRETQLKSTHLDIGEFSIGSNRGHSSPQHNPFVFVSKGSMQETSGDVFAIGLLYSGSFEIKTQINENGRLRIWSGFHSNKFSWKLSSSDKDGFWTMETILGFSSNGVGALSRELHSIIRSNVSPDVRRTKWTFDQKRPVLVNSWEAMYFDCTHQKIMDELVIPSKEFGIDLIVLDDGWFGNRFDDKRSLGDWQVNREKFPQGLDGLARDINSHGLKFGIWMEPEMVNVDSNLFRQHPDWALQITGRPRTEWRNQLVLDVSRIEVQEFMIESVSRVLESANIEYLKWDFNRPLIEIGNHQLPFDRQHEISHRYILGLYRVLDILTRKFPNVLFESCASGGGRFDLGMMYFTPQIWTSDNTDAIQRTKIQYGVSMMYPFNVMSAHVSTVPSHQTSRSTPLSTRHFVAMSGSFGYELSLSNFLKNKNEEYNMILDMTNLYKLDVQTLLFTGNLYRLNSPFLLKGNLNSQRGNLLSCWMIVSSDQQRAVLWIVLSSYFEVNFGNELVRLQGLNADKTYAMRRFGIHGLFSEGVKLHGSTLMSLGLNIEMGKDGDSQIVELRSV